VSVLPNDIFLPDEIRFWTEVAVACLGVSALYL
jgi:hypothetical protein